MHECLAQSYSSTVGCLSAIPSINLGWHALLKATAL